MIFFNKAPAAVYIRKNSLEFFVGEESKTLDFPEDIISNSDIVNSPKYEKLIEDFIAANNFERQKVLLVLSEEIIFDKKIPGEDLKILDDTIEDFLSMVPIDPDKLSKKTIKIDDSMYFLAVNKLLYEKLLEVLERLDLEVLAVVPLTVYSTDNMLSSDLIKRISSDNGLLKKVNLLSEIPVFDNKGSSKTIIAVIAFLSIAASIVGLLVKADYIKLPIQFLTTTTLETAQTPVAPVSTESAVPAEQTTSAYLEKDQLKVSVLNGTGVTGQAAKIKNLLIKLGLSQIETGNLKGESVQITTVAYSEVVDPDVADEVTALLEENFKTVSVTDKTSTQSADISIITGER